MAFSLKGLARIAVMGAADNATEVNSVWGYVTNDDAAAVQTAAYFNSQAAYIKKGDIIMASLDRDGATPVLKQYVVTAVSPNVVIAVQTTAA